MQSHLLPQSPADWLPAGHLAYFILDVVAELDLAAFHRAIQSKDQRGARPYAPDLMVALLLYGYCTGVFSSRRIARATHEDVPFRVIAGECHPHFTRIAAIRRENLSLLEGLFLQVLQLCDKAGLVKLGHVAIDGAWKGRGRGMTRPTHLGTIARHRRTRGAAIPQMDLRGLARE